MDLHVRHIQDHDADNTYIPYWGYPSRVVPCENDVGSCEYLEGVYWMHEVSMLYTFIMWGVLLGIGAVWLIVRGWRMGGSSQSMGTWFDKVADVLGHLRRRYLIKDAPLRWAFGRVSRLQVAIFAVLSVYLTIFSLVGIVYKTWVTPVEDYPGVYNTRTGLGGFSDRVGALAYALTPFAVLLSQRESILSLITGIPYQHFSCLHRWTGLIIYAQSVIHTIGWTIVEANLYKPQPSVYRDFIKQMYAIFGVIAMFLLTLMVVLSTKPAIDRFGYEFFKISHWILAILYIAACWGHWDRLWCWMVASLALIVIDQTVRALRTCSIHMNGGKGRSFGFKCAQAQVQVLGDADDMALRLDFDYEHREPWKPGQHFHICFPSLSIWQSHPFTPSSLPDSRSTMQHHTYILRVRKGITEKLAALEGAGTVPVVLTGPYGDGHPRHETKNVLAIAGGTGVTFTLPIAFATLGQPILPAAAVDFVWIIRRARDLRWISTELGQLKDLLPKFLSLRMSIFITRESQVSSDESLTEKERVLIKSSSWSSSGSTEGEALDELMQQCCQRFKVLFLGDHHPSVEDVVGDFMERASSIGGNVEVVGSGPEGLGSDLRDAVAKARTREAVGCYWDSRG